MLHIPLKMEKSFIYSGPFELVPAGEPATDPTPTAARSLARLLCLPQPDNIAHPFRLLSVVGLGGIQLMTGEPRSWYSALQLRDESGACGQT